MGILRETDERRNTNVRQGKAARLPGHHDTLWSTHQANGEEACALRMWRRSQGQDDGCTAGDQRFDPPRGKVSISFRLLTGRQRFSTSIAAKRRVLGETLMSTDERHAHPVSSLNEAPRYTVRMLTVFSPGHDIDGVCRMVRDSLERGIIPVISIDLSEEE